MFRGRYEHTIDAKGRTSLPARYRDVLSSIGERRIVLTSALDPCLVAYTAPEWTAFEERLAGRGFLRIHRSRLVNRARVAAFKPTPSGDLEITLDDGSVIGGSRRFRDALESA